VTNVMLSLGFTRSLYLEQQSSRQIDSVSLLCIIARAGEVKKKHDFLAYIR